METFKSVNKLCNNDPIFDEAKAVNIEKNLIPEICIETEIQVPHRPKGLAER